MTNKASHFFGFRQLFNCSCWLLLTIDSSWRLLTSLDGSSLLLEVLLNALVLMRKHLSKIDMLQGWEQREEPEKICKNIAKINLEKKSVICEKWLIAKCDKSTLSSIISWCNLPLPNENSHHCIASFFARIELWLKIFQCPQETLWCLSSSWILFLALGCSCLKRKLLMN